MKKFLFDMGARLIEKHTVERNDNDKGYCLENCRWATRTEQGKNTRRIKLNKELVDNIRELSSQGLSSLKIAPLVGISSSHIRKVVNRSIWNE